MTPEEKLLLDMLDAAVETAPHLVDAILKWANGVKARRVEEVRPPVARVDTEVEDLKKGDGA